MKWLEPREYNEKLHKLYPSPNIIRIITLTTMRWAGHETRIGEMRNAYNILIQRWDNIRMDLRGKRVGRRELDASGPR
jgi:hypothetical protein